MDFGPEAWPNQGRWVIRKQNRRIDYSGSDYEATVDILATYFVVGISVYEAPSVSEMMASRLVRTITSSTSDSLTIMCVAIRHLFDEEDHAESILAHTLLPFSWAPLLATESEAARREATHSWPKSRKLDGT